MRDPKRHLPLSLIAGTLAVVAIYVLVNVAYLRTLGLEGLANTATPAAETARRWFGSTGEQFVVAAIAISTFGFVNHCVLAPSRVYYAMAADGAFFASLARLHPRFHTPAAAIWLQSAIAILLLILPGGYGDLLGTVVFADWIFFGLTVAGLFVLRPPSCRSFRLSNAGISVAAGHVRLRRRGGCHQHDPRSANPIGDRHGIAADRRCRRLYWFRSQTHRSARSRCLSPRSHRICSGPKAGTPPRSIWRAAICSHARSTTCPVPATRSIITARNDNGYRAARRRHRGSLSAHDRSRRHRGAAARAQTSSP